MICLDLVSEEKIEVESVLHHQCNYQKEAVVIPVLISVVLTLFEEQELDCDNKRHYNTIDERNLSPLRLEVVDSLISIICVIAELNDRLDAHRDAHV